MPRVSVVIPTFNRAGLLPRAVESALAAGDDLEVIVVDDASEDETPRVCAGMRGVRYLRLGRNSGTAAARNAGVLASLSEFVAFLDDDDLRLPGSLDAQARLLEAAPGAAFCYGRLLVGSGPRMLPTGELVPRRCPAGDIFWELLEGNFVSPITVVARKRVLVGCGLFDQRLKMAEDWDMWLRVTERHPVLAFEEPVAIFRRAEVASGQKSSDAVRQCREILKIHEAALRLPRSLAAPRARRRRVRRRVLDTAYADMMYKAQRAIESSEGEAARERLRFAVRLHPFRTAALRWMLRCLRLRAPKPVEQRRAERRTLSR